MPCIWLLGLVLHSHAMLSCLCLLHFSCLMSFVTDCTLLEHGAHETVCLPSLLQVDVGDASDVSALMNKGASQRATSETKMNDRSSRSHQILTVIVDGVHKITRARSHGCLHLIDLAGSERVSKSEASGEHMCTCS